MRATIDTSELAALVGDLRSSANDLMGKVRPAIAKGALNVKKQMRDEAAQSQHFRIAHTISYDLTGNRDFAQAEIGPVKGGAGSLANIAYFGGAHGGGGTIPDPQGAADAEAPNLEKAIGDILAAIL